MNKKNSQCKHSCKDDCDCSEEEEKIKMIKSQSQMQQEQIYAEEQNYNDESRQ